MKRIEFIAPVAAMRGNLSGAQTLVYAKKDNPAWDAPEGKSYARNYKPRFIGAKRVATGATIFQTKVRSAINNSIKAKIAQAVLGSIPMLLSGVERNLSLNGNLFACYQASREKVEGYSLRKYFIEKVRSQVERGAATISIVERTSSGVVTCSFANPYIKPGTSTAPDILFDSAIVDKFFDQLSNGFRFKIEGVGKGLAFSGWEFGTIKDNPKYNVLGVKDTEVAGEQYATIGDGSLFIQYKSGENYVYVGFGDLVDVNKEYVVTDVAPGA